jgi:hypothetical protein
MVHPSSLALQVRSAGHVFPLSNFHCCVIGVVTIALLKAMVHLSVLQVGRQNMFLMSLQYFYVLGQAKELLFLPFE